MINCSQVIEELQPDIIGLQESYEMGIHIADRFNYCYSGNINESTAIFSKYPIEVISDINQLTSKPDVLVASDVLYDRDNLGILDSLSEHCDLALIADSRVRDPKIFDAYRLISEERSKTVPDLDEFEEFSLVNLYERKFR